MADTTKLMLSDVELHFVNDTNWVLTKHRIIATVYDLFNAQVPVIKAEMRDILNPGLWALASAVPKITKGENYRLLPYVMLDYPSVFNKEDIFALRTMFWWGNFVSITLHLAGKYQSLLADNIIAGVSQDPSRLYICVNEDQWAHHFEPANYIPATEMTYAETKAVLQQSGFIKLALKFELETWNDMPSLLATGYRKMARLLSDQLPTR